MKLEELVTLDSPNHKADPRTQSTQNNKETLATIHSFGVINQATFPLKLNMLNSKNCKEFNMSQPSGGKTTLSGNH